MPLPFTTFSRSHLLDTSWLTVGVSEQVIGMGAEADGLAAGAGLAMTTAGWDTAGVGWMGCTCEKKANKPYCLPAWLWGGGVSGGNKRKSVHGILTHSVHSCLCPVKKQDYKRRISTHPMITTSKISIEVPPPSQAWEPPVIRADQRLKKVQQAWTKPR